MRPYTADMPIHESCNATEREALTQALADVKTLAQWGKDCRHCLQQARLSSQLMLQNRRCHQRRPGPALSKVVRPRRLL